MNNITKWMKSITKEEFGDFFSIRDLECTNCPAKEQCKASDNDNLCEEEFYEWALEEGGEK